MPRRQLIYIISILWSLLLQNQRGTFQPIQFGYIYSYIIWLPLARNEYMHIFLNIYKRQLTNNELKSLNTEILYVCRWQPKSWLEI